MECEDALAQNTRAALWEADERERMAEADAASRAAAEAASAAAWAEKVQRSKAALLEERQTSRRERDAMTAEDFAAMQLRERDRELARMKEAEAAAVAAAVAAAKQRE